MATPVAAQVTAVRSPSQTGDIIARLVTLVFAGCILLLAGLVVLELWQGSAPARSHLGWNFLVSSDWNPVTDQYGALPFLYGTVVTAFVALLISVPLGLGAAIFLSELAPAGISSGLTFLVELLAAVPSVIYGLMALFTIVPLMREYVGPFLNATLGFLPFFQGRSYGVGYLPAALVLSIMTFPFIISVSREALLAVPREQREASLALGATQWETTWKVVVPYAKLGILGSVFLGLARALGETMAVTMVIGNAADIHVSLLAPGATIAAVIANEFTEASGKIYSAALIELGLVLFCLTIVINGFARLMIVATTRKGSKRS
ncbi:MAG TPA: phosphate ABC transporter permease subunit PstC [Bryobacteraceae bacterium]|nr:phosphate ABC transporter permease subunit PstC [Bryobacteraceae bacterium]